MVEDVWIERYEICGEEFHILKVMHKSKCSSDMFYVKIILYCGKMIYNSLSNDSANNIIDFLNMFIGKGCSELEFLRLIALLKYVYVKTKDGTYYGVSLSTDPKDKNKLKYTYNLDEYILNISGILDYSGW